METTKSINDWADSTFGKPKSRRSLIQRAQLEAIEMVDERARKKYGKRYRAVAVEAADVAIVLARYYRRNWIGHIDSVLSREAVSMSLAEAVETVAKILNDALQLDDYLLEEHMIDSQDRLATLLASIAIKCGANIGGQIDKKMAINRKREWTLTDAGHGFHVEVEDAA